MPLPALYQALQLLPAGGLRDKAELDSCLPSWCPAELDAQSPCSVTGAGRFLTPEPASGSGLEFTVLTLSPEPFQDNATPKLTERSP